MSEIDLSDIAIACPDLKGKARFMSACIKCPYYGGMVQVCEDKKRQDWENFHVVCNRPVTRRMERIER